MNEQDTTSTATDLIIQSNPEAIIAGIFMALLGLVLGFFMFRRKKEDNSGQQTVIQGLHKQLADKRTEVDDLTISCDDALMAKENAESALIREREAWDAAEAKAAEDAARALERESKAAEKAKNKIAELEGLLKELGSGEPVDVDASNRIMKAAGQWMRFKPYLKASGAVDKINGAIAKYNADVKVHLKAVEDKVKPKKWANQVTPVTTITKLKAKK